MGELFVVLFRFLLIILAYSLVRSIFRSVMQGFRGATIPPAKTKPPAVVTGELKKDPVCGTYVSTTGSVSRKVNGELIYFCSPECRDKYRVA